MLVPQLGMCFVGIIPVHPQNQQVEPGRSQVILYELQEVVQTPGRGRFDGQTPHRKKFIDGFGRPDRQEDGQQDRRGKKESFHRSAD